jgi:hypothetical protein
MNANTKAGVAVWTNFEQMAIAAYTTGTYPTKRSRDKLQVRLYLFRLVSRIYG